MYAYCGNNPISRYDPEGTGWFGAILGAVVGAVVGGVSAWATGGDPVDVLIGAVAGAATGAVTGATGDLKKGKTAGRIVGAGCSAVGTYIDAKRNGASTKNALISAGVAFVNTYSTSSISGATDSPLVGAALDSTIGFAGSLTTCAVATGLTNASKNTTGKTSAAKATSQGGRRPIHKKQALCYVAEVY